MENGFQGKDGQVIPEMTDEIISSISNRYIELYEKVSGETFTKADISSKNSRIVNNVLNYLNN